MSELVVPYGSFSPQRPPYSRSLRFWGIGFALLALIFDQAFVQVPGKALLEDFLAFGLIGLVGWLGAKTLQLKRRKSRGIEMDIPSVSTTLPSFPHFLVSFASIIFLMLWLSRWSQGPGLALHPEEALRYRTFLHAGSLLALSAFIAASQRIRSMWEVLDLTPGRMVLLSYGIASLVGTFLLILPLSLQPQASLPILDALFVSVSAISVTGLSPVDVSQTFSLFGQSVILVGIQLGGIGIVVLSVGLAVVTRQRLSLSESLMGRELYDLPEIGGVKAFVLRVVLFTFAIEAMGFVWIYFSLPQDLPHRLFHAVFHTVSAFCNAGFSSFSSNLNLPGLFWMKGCVAVLIILGSIGFPVIFEGFDRLRGKPSRRTLSPHFILNISAVVVLLVVGTLSLFLIEVFRSGAVENVVSTFGSALFHSISARTAGFNIAEISDLNQGSQLVLVVLMIIGGSPLSTAGGVKTTTAAVIIVSMASLLRGHKWIQFRSSEISYFVLQKCVAIVVLYTLVALVAVVLLMGFSNLDAWMVTFEAISALSTTGLSLGATAELGAIGKMIIIALMLIGRLGLITIVYIGVGTLSSQRFRYPQEKYFVG